MKIPTVKAVLINKNSLVLKITIPGTQQYKYKNLDHKIDPKKWNVKAGLCTGSHPECEAINTLIFTERNALVALFEADKAKGVMFSGSHIADRLAGIEYDSANFYAFSTQQIGIKNYKPSTRKNYNGEITKMKKYAADLVFSDITFTWLQGYENYMRTKLTKPNQSNTVWKSLKFINTMITQAIKIGGIIDKNPFKVYGRGRYKQTIPLYLEWSEVMKLHDAIRSKPMSALVRLCGYYSLLSFFSGLRWGDAMAFDYNRQVIEDANGKRLVLYAAKNGEIVSIAFTKYIAEVVEYIKDKPLKISNQDFNTHLKSIASIAELARVEKDISSHAGRHSFGMKCAELDISIERTQKLMGHIQQSSTAIYYRVKNKSLDDAMGKWDA